MEKLSYVSEIVIWQLVSSIIGHTPATLQMCEHCAWLWQAIDKKSMYLYVCLFVL